MKTAEPKNTSVATIQKSGKPFFGKEGDGDFFGDSIKQQTNFFKPSSSLSVGKGVLQTKLTIGQPNDKYEREADSMADRVVQRLATPEIATKKENGVQRKPLSLGITPVIQAKCASCENEEKLQKKEEDELQKLSLMDLRRKPIFESNAEPPDDDNTVHRKCSACENEEKVQKKSGSAEQTASSDIESSLMSSKGSGSPLPSATREQMESSFGADFSGVRIHTGSSAQGMSKDLHAQAFTHGNDIYFNSGRYDTNSTTGQHLLAHELTHTLQQGGSSTSRRKIQRWPDWVSDAADWVSDTASDVGGAVADGARAVGGAVADGARWVGGQVADGASWVVDQVSAAAQWVIDQIRSVINSGTNYLTEKWEQIKEFGRTCFDDIKNGFGDLVHFVTNPLSSLMSALSMMNADLFVGVWDTLKTGANALWGGINSVINGVLQIGRGIWDTVSGFINGIFGTIEGLFSNAAFDLLPDFIKSEARSIFNGLRTLWNEVSTFWTDLWRDLTSKIQEILTGIRSFVDNIIGYAIDKVVSMVRGLKEVYDYVMRIFADPEAFIRPILAQIAAKLNAEAPPNAKKFGEDLSRQAYPGGSPTTDTTSDNGDLQLQGEEEDSDRRTATFTEVVTGLWFYIVRAWDQLDILQMLWDTVVNMFWPPATIRAIVAQFSILWNEEWAHTLDSLYTPRNFFDTPLGCLHDIWSNFLILLEFPLALWRTLNYVVGLLMGYITIILVLGLAIVGGVLAAEVGVVPGLIAGAGLGLEIAAGLGEILMGSYIAAETLTVEVALVQLFTARQTCAQREKDLLTTVSSLVGMGVSLALEFLMSVLADIVTAIVEAIRGIRKPPQPQPTPPQPNPPAPTPPGPNPPAPTPPGPTPPGPTPPAPTPPAPTPPAPTPPAPTPPAPTPPAPTPPAPVPPAPVPPAPVPPAPVPPAPVPPAPRPPAPRPRPRPRPRPQPQPQLQLSPLVGDGHVITTLPSLSKKDETSADGNDSIEIQRQSLRGLAAGPRVATAATLRQGQGGIDPDRCEADECELPYKWTRNNPTVPGNPVLRYCGKKKNSYVKHGHHSWPKYLGGPENQGRLLPVDENIHRYEFHNGNATIHKAVETALNASRDYGNLLQGNPLTTRTSSRGNQILIEKMRTGGGNDAVLRTRVKNIMMGYYLVYRTNSKPRMPIAAYSTGLNNSVNNIR